MYVIGVDIPGAPFVIGAYIQYNPGMVICKLNGYYIDPTLYSLKMSQIIDNSTVCSIVCLG